MYCQLPSNLEPIEKSFFLLLLDEFFKDYIVTPSGENCCFYIKTHTIIEERVTYKVTYKVIREPLQVHGEFLLMSFHRDFVVQNYKSNHDIKQVILS